MNPGEKVLQSILAIKNNGKRRRELKAFEKWTTTRRLEIENAQRLRRRVQLSPLVSADRSDD